MANIIKMLKAVLLIALALTVSSSEELSASSTPTKDFIQGFLAGLGETNPAGACSSALIKLTSAVYGVINDVEVKNQNMQDTINSLNSLQTVVDSYKASRGSCKLSTLDDQFKKIFSKDGMDIVIKNYLANGESIFKDYQQIAKCSSDYYQCGFASGDAFEKLVGWSLD
jgi:hypothetical protein